MLRTDDIAGAQPKSKSPTRFHNPLAIYQNQQQRVLLPAMPFTMAGPEATLMAASLLSRPQILDRKLVGSRRR